jgi:hypothetical protein
MTVALRNRNSTGALAINTENLQDVSSGSIYRKDSITEEVGGESKYS